MHNSHIAKASRGELCREKKKKRRKINHDRNKLKIKYNH